jgi:hypothetical protein
MHGWRRGRDPAARGLTIGVTPDQIVARIAARQHTIVHRRQLLAAGLSARQIHRRVLTGRLHPVHRGVYAVGVPVHTDHARWMAAALAVDGWLTGRSAAALWRMWDSARSAENVAVARRGKGPTAGVVVHRATGLEPRDLRTRDGIPVLAPARVLLDLAATVSRRQLETALTEARVRRLVDDDALRDVLARFPGRRGAPALRRAFAGPFTRSQLERRFLALLDEHGLGRPQVNALVGGDEVDMLFTGGLAVELDGRGAHAGRWAADAAKDARLRDRGLRVLRLTWWDVVRDRARTADALRAA